MGNDNAVEFERVSKVYVTEKVVDDVSFQVREGEIFILIGPSGCGKTTTLKMINQLIPLAVPFAIKCRSSPAKKSQVHDKQ
jgi:ABC-type proline/glycine betaine transport system ATPase subunit